MVGFVGITGLWVVVQLNSRRQLGSSASVGCGLVSVLWWVSVVHEWIAGFNMVSMWVNLWVNRCVRGGGSGGFCGSGCGCFLVGRVGVCLVDFFFLCCGL